MDCEYHPSERRDERPALSGGRGAAQNRCPFNSGIIGHIAQEELVRADESGLGCDGVLQCRFVRRRPRIQSISAVQPVRREIAEIIPQIGNLGI